MSALRFLFITLLLAIDSVFSAEGQRITAKAGQDSVTLPCGAGKDKEILAVDWIRADLDPDYVLLYRDGRFESDGQHPFFRNRVDLQDRQMKDGNVSLILKDVKIKDTGTYECRVYQGGGNRKRAAKEIISSIHLEVSSPPGTPEGGGSVGLTVGLLVPVLLFLQFLLFFLICRTKPSRRKLFSCQTLAKAPEPELVKEPLLPPSEPSAEPEPEPEPESPAEPEPELIVEPLLPPSEAPAAGSPR